VGTTPRRCLLNGRRAGRFGGRLTPAAIGGPCLLSDASGAGPVHVPACDYHVLRAAVCGEPGDADPKVTWALVAAAAGTVFTAYRGRDLRQMLPWPRAVLDTADRLTGPAAAWVCWTASTVHADDWDRLTCSSDRNVLGALCGRSDTPPDVVDRLIAAVGGDPHLRSELASHAPLTPDHYRHLAAVARRQQLDLTLDVLTNPAVEPAVSSAAARFLAGRLGRGDLTRRREFRWRELVRSFPPLPADLVARMAVHPDRLVRSAAAAHPALDAASHMRLLGDPAAVVRALAALRPVDDDRVVARLADDPAPGVREAVTRQPAVASDVLDRFVRAPEGSVRRAAASSPFATPDAVEVWASADDLEVRAGVATSPHSTPAVHARLCADPCPLVRAVAVGHCPDPERLAAHTADPSFDVRLALAVNPHTTWAVAAGLPAVDAVVRHTPPGGMPHLGGYALDALFGFALRWPGTVGDLFALADSVAVP
jgi:hypothetical protein